MNAIFKLVKINFGSKFGAWVIFPYRYLVVLKISRKSGADRCNTPLISPADWQRSDTHGTLSKPDLTLVYPTLRSPSLEQLTPRQQWLPPSKRHQAWRQPSGTAAKRRIRRVVTRSYFWIFLTFPDRIRSFFLRPARRAPKNVWKFRCLCLSMRRLDHNQRKALKIFVKIGIYTDFEAIFPDFSDQIFILLFPDFYDLWHPCIRLMKSHLRGFR